MSAVSPSGGCGRRVGAGLDQHVDDDGIPVERCQPQRASPRNDSRPLTLAPARISNPTISTESRSTAQWSAVVPSACTAFDVDALVDERPDRRNIVRLDRSDK
jgi:hypothetical protein